MDIGRCSSGTRSAFSFDIAHAGSRAEELHASASRSVVADPPEVRSHNGVLEDDLTYSNFKDADGQERYCYWDKSGAESPTLRISPGDLLILHLKNELVSASSTPKPAP